MESICVFQSIIALPDRDLLAILVLKQTDDDKCVSHVHYILKKGNDKKTK